MNTFLPFRSYEDSARVIDKSRLWKQVLECSQLFDVIFRKTNLLKDGKKGWINHPVLKIWTDKNGTIYIYQLLNYFSAFYGEHVRRGGKVKTFNFLEKYGYIISMIDKNPNLWGDLEAEIRWSKEFHDTMKANLIRKDRKHYQKYFGKGIRAKEGYLWENCKLKK